MNCSQHQIIGIPPTLTTQGPELNQITHKECRICLVEQQSNPTFLSPCHCSGSMQFVHFNCLSQWITRTEASLLRQQRQSYEHTCQMCKFKIKFECQQQCSCITWKQFKNKVVNRTSVFVILLLLTLTCIGLVVGGIVVISLQDKQDATGNFTVVVLVIAVAIVCVLLIVIAFVWVLDYCVREVRVVSRISDRKRRVERRGSDAEMPRLKPALTTHSKSTGTRMTVYPQFFVAQMQLQQ